MIEILNRFHEFNQLPAIFISGLRRSGTTLIQRLLDGHSQLLVYPLEDCIIRDFFFTKKVFDLSGLGTLLEKRDWENVYQCLIDNPKLFLALQEDISSQDRNTSKIHFHLGNQFSLQNNIDQNEFRHHFLEILNSFDKPVDIGDLTRIWMFTYFYTKGVRNFSEFKAWVTKCPDDGKCFVYYQQYFSSVKIIHLVRDPRGFYASEKQKRMDLDQFNPSKLLEKSVNLWLTAFENAKNNLILAPENYFLLRYEDLVLNLDQTRKSITSFLGIIDEGILSRPTFDGNPWGDNSSFSAIQKDHQAVNKKPLHHWKNSLSLSEILYLEWSLGREMIELDYTNPIRAKAAKFGFSLLRLLKNKRGLILKRLKKIPSKQSPKRRRKSLKQKSPVNKEKLSRFFIHLSDKKARNISAELSRFKNKYSGQRCFIMGNGPSLNQMDLSLFQNEFVWASNRCYLLFDQIKWRPKFFVAVDKRVVPDNSEEINQLSAILPDSFLFFPIQFRYDHVIRSAKNVYWFTERKNNESNLPYSMFSLNPADFLYSVKTVTISALQLAVYFGFNPIYLIGCDTNYTVPDTIIYEGDDKNLLISSDDDPNHFHKDYFGVGKKWHPPNVERMIFHYEQSKMVCEENNVEIYDATVAGKLEVFPKIDYRSLFK